jgi:DNA-binding IclR family transcriptional regulator
VERNLDDLRAVGLGATATEVQTNLKKIRKAGVAVAFGEVTPGAVGIAAAVLDERKMPIASLCVTVAGGQVTGAQIDEISAEVRRVAKLIGAGQDRR